MILRFEAVLGDGGVEGWAVEADDDVAGGVDDRNGANARFIEGFHAGRWVEVDVVIGVFNAQAVEIVFGHVARATPFSPVDCNLCVITHTSSLAQYYTL